MKTLLFVLVGSVALSAQGVEQPGAWAPAHQSLAAALGRAAAVAVATERAYELRHAYPDESRVHVYWQRLGCPALAAIGIAEIAKRAFPEPRPNGRDDLSVVSEDTALAVSAVGRRFVVTIPLAAFAAYARYASNEHWPRNLWKGAVIGAVAQAACLAEWRAGS